MRPVRAFSISAADSRAIWRSDLVCTSRSTGTSSPRSVSTAMPMLAVAAWTMRVALEAGIDHRVLQQRLRDQLGQQVVVGRDRLARRRLLSCLRSRTSSVASASVVRVTGATVCALVAIRSAMVRRTVVMGSTGAGRAP